MSDFGVSFSGDAVLESGKVVEVAPGADSEWKAVSTDCDFVLAVRGGGRVVGGPDQRIVEGGSGISVGRGTRYRLHADSDRALVAVVLEFNGTSNPVIGEQ